MAYSNEYVDRLTEEIDRLRAELADWQAEALQLRAEAEDSEEALMVLQSEWQAFRAGNARVRNYCETLRRAEFGWVAREVLRALDGGTE